MRANRRVTNVVLICPVFNGLDVQSNIPVLPVLPYAANLAVGLDRIDHDDFKLRAFIAALFFERQQTVDVFQRLFKGQPHDLAVGVGIKTLNGYLEFVES